ncbi:MAG TPA: hypothetical protein VE028_04095 [Nitratidesulfovibrio sp.]|nr:hypothetical protein [Nitratidesulfovibrio sp.]
MALHYYICADCGSPIALGDACTCWQQRKPWLGKVLLAAIAAWTIILVLWGLA